PDVSGLISFASHFLRREIRAIGFNKDFVQRHKWCRFLNRIRFGESDDAGERDKKSQGFNAWQNFRPAGETMKDAPDRTLAFRGQNVETFVPGIAAVNYDRLFQIAGQ